MIKKEIEKESSNKLITNRCGTVTVYCLSCHYRFEIIDKVERCIVEPADSEGLAVIAVIESIMMTIAKREGLNEKSIRVILFWNPAFFKFVSQTHWLHLGIDDNGVHEILEFPSTVDEALKRRCGNQYDNLSEYLGPVK